MKIKLHFVTTNSWVSKVIRAATWSDFSHVEFLIDDSAIKLLGLQDKIKPGYLGALGKGGVQIRGLHYDNWTRELFLETEDLPDTVVNNILEFAIGAIGDKYDWSALFAMGFRRDWREPGAYFCSELVAAAFDAAGYPLLNDWGQMNRITPRDVLMSPRLNRPSVCV